jgi:hypothetical protein
MIEINDAFSTRYAKARVKFLESTGAAGMALRSFAHPLKGRDGEDLAMDVALDGSPDAQNLLIVSSACHGVEGYCGSGVQTFAARDAEWLAKSRAAGVAVLYIHALNPHGFSHLRRTTHENVDLNRNFQRFDQPLPENAAYADLHALLLPQEWPPTSDNQAAIAAYIQANGVGRFQAAVSQGQYAFTDGMFFGGTEPTWSNHILRRVLQTYGAKAERIAWMDLHTGLGPSGVGERIFACRDEPQALVRARAWWGGDGTTPITSFYDGSSNSARLTGLMWSAIHDECPQAEYTGIAMEYGTLPILDMIFALRADHWLHLHPEAPPALRTSIQSQVMDAFYVDTDAWHGQVIVQARQALFQAVDGLCSAS